MCGGLVPSNCRYDPTPDNRTSAAKFFHCTARVQLPDGRTSQTVLIVSFAYAEFGGQRFVAHRMPAIQSKATLDHAPFVHVEAIQAIGNEPTAALQQPAFQVY